MIVYHTAFMGITVLLHNTWGAKVQCDTECPRKMSPFNISCSAEGSGNLQWFQGSTLVMTCFPSTRLCTREEIGYSGFQINNTFFILQIDKLDTSSDNANWLCQLGTDSGTCKFPVIEDPPTGIIEPDCRAVGDPGFRISSSGVTSLGTPAATLLFTHNGKVIRSTNTSLTPEATVNGVDGEHITVSMTGLNEKCLLQPATKRCPDTGPSKKSGLAFVIITAILLGVGIIAMIVVSVMFAAKKNEKREKLRLSCLIIGIVWIVVGLVGTIIVLVIGSQIQPGSVLPAGTITVVGLVFSVITLLAGLATLLVAGCLLSGKNLNEGKQGANMQAQDQPLQDRKENLEEDKTKQKQGEKEKADDIRM